MKKFSTKVGKSGKKWEFIFTFTQIQIQVRMNGLFGVYECSADAKGRVMFPVAFKKQMTQELKAGFVLKRSIFSKSLELFPMSVWHEIVKELNTKNRYVKKNMDFIRLFNAGVVQLELDSAGRLLIPKDLITFGAIKKDVVMAAAGDRIEIWDKKGYEKFIKDNAGNFESLAEEVMGGITPTDSE